MDEYGADICCQKRSYISGIKCAGQHCRGLLFKKTKLKKNLHAILC